MLRMVCGSMVLLATICFAAMEGGPKPMRADRTTSVVGAVPIPNCNANVLKKKPCPAYKFQPCGLKERGYLYDALKPVASGGVKEKRFENGPQACNYNDTAGCLAYDLYDMVPAVDWLNCTPIPVP
jgi:hypothetical protein